MSSLQIGIVGLPNVGKSTLFNALLKQQAALAANYPFATIEPNVGVVPVPDERLEQLGRVIMAEEKLVSSPPLKPATVGFVDIAGLVKGASQGEGLGNQFLAHIREVDLICHVLRDFADENVLREGSVDAQADRETIETELLLADLATLDKQKPPKATKDKDLLARWKVVENFKAAAETGKLISTVIGQRQGGPDLNSPTSAAALMSAVAKELNLLTAKKILYVINVEEDRAREHHGIAVSWAEKLGVSTEEIIVISAQIGSELSSLSTEDQLMYLEDLGLEKSGLERLIQRAYQALKLQSFLTAGAKEVRAWTIPAGLLAPQAAGTIHTDFEKKFIKAKVASYDDFVNLGGWKGVKIAGKVRLEGKDYVMQPGDVVEFMVGS